MLDQLGRVDVKIEEEDQALLLLTSLSYSFEHMVTTVLYGKHTLQMREIESALLSYEKTRRKVEDNSGLHFLLMVRIKEEGMWLKDLTVTVGLNPRIAERKCSATSARSGDT